MATTAKKAAARPPETVEETPAEPVAATPEEIQRVLATVPHEILRQYLGDQAPAPPAPPADPLPTAAPDGFVRCYNAELDVTHDLPVGALDAYVGWEPVTE